MNVPNLITITRFFLIPLFIVVFFSDHAHANLLSFLVLTFAGFTDILDGYLARKNHQITEIGKLLDPLADKMTMIAVIFSFVIDQRISWLATGVFLFRDIGMIISSAFFHFQGKRKVPGANYFGKATTVLYYIAILMIMFQISYYMEFLWGVIIFSFITAFIYLFRFMKMNDWRERAHNERYER